MTAVAIIPARGGSQRIPRKNIRDFAGKPIIAYSIATALESRCFDAVYVSTEDHEIMQVAQAHSARLLVRDPKYAQDDVGTQEVMRDALNALHGVHGETYDYACCIYATAPLMLAKDLIAGFQYLKDLRLHTPYVHTVGQDYKDPGQWYWGRTSAFIEGVPLTKSWGYVLPAERVCDINTPEDWVRAEQLYAEMKGLSNA